MYSRVCQQVFLMEQIRLKISALMLLVLLLIPPTQAYAVDGTADVQPPSTVPLAEIRRFVSVFNTVRKAYVLPVDDAVLMQSAVEGLLWDLDPHSRYMDAEQTRAFNESSQGSYEGIGVEVQTKEDAALHVIAPIEGGPAEKAGIQAGDVIIAVDGISMEKQVRSDPLRGPLGSTVTLTVSRIGQTLPLEVRIVRQAIVLNSVRSRWLDTGIAYVRISSFQVDTGAEFQKNVERLQRETQSIRGLLLDLRSNPGGLLTSAVEVADALLVSGRIVSTRGRLAISDSQFDAEAGDVLDGAAVVVLVDAGSASAAEVLAGALQDHGRAIVAGSQTFGKGSVQAILPLDNGDSIKLTTALYYTPSGRSIQGIGIRPDIILRADAADALDGLKPQSEGLLRGHLIGENESSAVAAGELLPGQAPLTAALQCLRDLVEKQAELPADF